MRKVGRNDPCPCGSGKKYKKCHGASNVIEINPKRYNDQLVQLQADLIDFAYDDYGFELQSMIEERVHPDLVRDEDLFNLYTSAVVSWAIFHHILDNGRTIFEEFYQYKHKGIKNGRVKKVFASWAEMPVTFFESVTVDDQSILIEDIRNNKTYEIDIQEGDDFSPNSLIAGFILPFVQEHRIFFSLFELSDEHGEQYSQITKLSESQLREYYPEILGEFIVEEILPPRIEYAHYQYYRAAYFFEQKMLEKDASYDLIHMGKVIWKMFTDIESPKIVKPWAYAAALEYILQTRVLKVKLYTQKDLAKHYQVTAPTISKIARQIEDTLSPELDKLSAKIIRDDDN